MAGELEVDTISVHLTGLLLGWAASQSKQGVGWRLFLSTSSGCAVCGLTPTNHYLVAIRHFVWDALALPSVLRGRMQTCTSCRPGSEWRAALRPSVA